jgi:hypothetical protein
MRIELLREPALKGRKRTGIVQLAPAASDVQVVESTLNCAGAVTFTAVVAAELLVTMRFSGADTCPGFKAGNDRAPGVTCKLMEPTPSALGMELTGIV